LYIYLYVEKIRPRVTREVDVFEIKTRSVRDAGRGKIERTPLLQSSPKSLFNINYYYCYFLFSVFSPSIRYYTIPALHSYDRIYRTKTSRIMCIYYIGTTLLVVVNIMVCRYPRILYSPPPRRHNYLFGLFYGHKS